MQENILDLLKRNEQLEAENSALRERNSFLERACAHWQFLSGEQAKEIRKHTKKSTVSPFFDEAHAPR